MVIMDEYTRRIIGFSVHAGNVDGPALCRMFNEATSEQGWPNRISTAMIRCSNIDSGKRISEFLR